MAKIVITEIDETLPASVAESTDIVYVPGFADTNSNLCILTDPGDTPSVDGSGNAGLPNREDFNQHSGGVPNYCVNTYDRRLWRWSVHSWVEVDYYLEPYPENEPILCDSLAEFVKNFGNTPYQFNKEGEEYIAWPKNLLLSKTPLPPR